MAEQLLTKINELLNEEKWTRATLNSYSIANFKDLDVLIKEIEGEKKEDEVEKICSEHLHHTKNSIIALYLAGIFSLKKQLIDDSNLVMLISIFSDNHKWKIVEFLCNRILEFGENKFALKTLAECYENENESDLIYEVWERLIKIDYEESDIVKSLAEKYEADDNIELAVDYYKKALQRYINKKLFTNVKDIWKRLIEFCPEDLDFFFQMDKKIAKTISSDRASQLLEDLFEFYKEKKNWDKGIVILKRVLTYDPKNDLARKEITNCFKEKYKGHSHLDEYIRVSNLTQSWRNVHEAIQDFEKHISFDAGNFVCHRSWGIGKIANIKGDSITIDFARKRNHKMSLKMAVSALSFLEKEHIWVLKCITKKDVLKKKIKTDIPWALKTIIKSFDNAADMKKIKAEIVPSILTPGEWTSWSTEARKILKTDSDFGNLPDQLDQFVVREQPISFAEKTFNRFKAEKNFFSKIKTIQDFVKHSEPESEYFNEMFLFFTNYLKAFSAVNETIIASYLVVSKIVKQYPFLGTNMVSIDFNELLSQVENIDEVFIKIEDTDLKKDFLEMIKLNQNNWTEIFIKLFPVYLSKYVIDELSDSGEKDKIKDMFYNILEHYKEYREAFIWIARNIDEIDAFKGYDFDPEKILIGMIHLLDISFREIDNRRDLSLNRKINRQIQTYLFKEDRLKDYMKSSSEESISRLFSLVNDIKDLDPSIKIEFKKIILERFPDFKFYGTDEPEMLVRGTGLLSTEKSYKSKQKELAYILDVEIPQNSKEIGAAIELGDLKENAEYKAGKEKQELLNIAVGKLKTDLEKVQVFKNADVDTSSVSFGTIVTLLNNDTSKEEVYTILGPWESDPTKKIISYQSPLGAAIWNHKKDEELSFVINERNYNYKIVNIEKADF